MDMVGIWLFSFVRRHNTDYIDPHHTPNSIPRALKKLRVIVSTPSVLSMWILISQQEETEGTEAVSPLPLFSPVPNKLLDTPLFQFASPWHYREEFVGTPNDIIQ
jgi:hypothetical protein